MFDYTTAMSVSSFPNVSLEEDELASEKLQGDNCSLYDVRMCVRVKAEDNSFMAFT